MCEIKVKTIKMVAENIKTCGVNLSNMGKSIILGSLNDTNRVCGEIGVYDMNTYVYDINAFHRNGRITILVLV